MRDRKSSRVVASIEARMGSSRLPGKVLADVAGQPALSRLLARLRACQSLDDIVLATSTDPLDDALESWARANGVAFWRGSEDDVLQRVVDAQRSMKADVVVEITGDSILTDPEVVDLGVDTYFANDCDVVSNCGQIVTWPMGINVQVFSFALLDEVARTVHDAAVREHVSLYFYENPQRYRLIDLVAPRRLTAPEWRTQLDYPEDLAFINEMYRRLAPEHGDCFGTEALFALLRREPGLLAINAGCEERAAR